MQNTGCLWVWAAVVAMTTVLYKLTESNVTVAEIRIPYNSAPLRKVQTTSTRRLYC